MCTRSAAFLLAAALFTILTSGCGNRNELTRGHAQELLEKHPSLKGVRRIPVRGDEFQSAVAGGWWSRDGSPAPEIAGVIESVLYDQKKHLGYFMTLRKPVDLTVQVTGIADVPSGDGTVKHVEFTWDYRGLPAAIRFWAVSPRPSSAGFVLYDDGWRIASGPELNSSDEAPVLSESEKTELSQVEGKIQERRQTEHQKETLAKEAEAKRASEAEAARVAKQCNYIIGNAATNTTNLYKAEILGPGQMQSLHPKRRMRNGQPSTVSYTWNRDGKGTWLDSRADSGTFEWTETEYSKGFLSGKLRGTEGELLEIQLSCPSPIPPPVS